MIGVSSLVSSGVQGSSREHTDSSLKRGKGGIRVETKAVPGRHPCRHRLQVDGMGYKMKGRNERDAR